MLTYQERDMKNTKKQLKSRCCALHMVWISNREAGIVFACRTFISKGRDAVNVSELFVTSNLAY
jgi:hypothetical protein